MEFNQNSDYGENNIEFLRNQQTATVCFSQGRFINKIKALKEKYPDDVNICVENEDGSIVAHIPTRWVKIAPPRQVDITEERKEELRQQLERARAERNEEQ